MAHLHPFTLSLSLPCSRACWRTPSLVGQVPSARRQIQTCAPLCHFQWRRSAEATKCSCYIDVSLGLQFIMISHRFDDANNGLGCHLRLKVKSRPSANPLNVNLVNWSCNKCLNLFLNFCIKSTSKFCFFPIDLHPDVTMSHS